MHDMNDHAARTSKDYPSSQGSTNHIKTYIHTYISHTDIYISLSSLNSNRPGNLLLSVPDADALHHAAILLHHDLRRPLLHPPSGLVHRLHVPRTHLPPPHQPVVRVEYPQRYVYVELRYVTLRIVEVPVGLEFPRSSQPPKTKYNIRDVFSTDLTCRICLARPSTHGPEPLDLLPRNGDHDPHLRRRYGRLARLLPQAAQ